ncbi:hypothetical protein BAE44_0007937 [Dichanthelium oligosanthes]|uniref:Uncharacterized protein n=1 Tax=Dichanthelium oligosanthes TaxID=888268 RepID=A0A1E5W0X9_9POAL|nr:hypothetical protein BAE44_0007937 [Dichanthelium oligosanthes]
MQGGAPPPASSTAPRTHEAAQEGQRDQDKRESGGGRPIRNGELEIEGSEMPRSVFFIFFFSLFTFCRTFCLDLCSHLQYRKMSRKSFMENESNVDHMEHYKYVLSKLLLEQDDSFGKVVSKEVQGTSTQNKGKEGYICNRTFPLFTKQISGLSENDKDRIKLALHEIVTFLNNDVDEVDRDIKAIEESGETCQEALKKLTTGLLGKLGKMAEGVDDLLNTAASKCR